MRNVLIGLIVIIVVLAGAYMLLPASGQNPPDTTDNTYAEYFEDKLVARGVEDIGQPIEGFDAALLIMAFPGLTEADFQGVKTLEGHYELRGGTLEFVRDQNQPVSSAERMVSSEGYATLLTNVSNRLAVPVTSIPAVDDIITRIDTGDRLEARIDQGASALGVRVVPLEVLEDSRCPTDVQCIQAGTVRIKARLSSGLGEADQEFKLNQPITTEAETVTLIQVSPEKESTVEIKESDYIFIFEVKKR